jgi:hypothetical protein
MQKSEKCYLLSTTTGKDVCLLSGERVLQKAREIADELRETIFVRDHLTDRIVARVAPLVPLVPKLLLLVGLLSALAGCAETKPAPQALEKQTSATDLLAQEQGALLLKYDQALVRAEHLLQQASRVIANAKEKTVANPPDQQFSADALANKARSAAHATE